VKIKGEENKGRFFTQILPGFFCYKNYNDLIKLYQIFLINSVGSLIMNRLSPTSHNPFYLPTVGIGSFVVIGLISAVALVVFVRPIREEVSERFNNGLEKLRPYVTNIYIYKGLFGETKKERLERKDRERREQKELSLALLRSMNPNKKPESAFFPFGL
jgi:hypothetical protein